VRCELQREATASMSTAEHSGVGGALAERVKTLVGVTAKVTVLPVDSLPRTEVGKAKRVSDERPKQL
jgi:phenylacetate-CoA ligase